MSDMDHMNYLNLVAHRDVECVQEKERTYQGSWKSQGGKNAWAMIRRKIDRLMIMLGDPKPPPGFNLQNVSGTIEAIRNGSIINSPDTMQIGCQFPGTQHATVLILQHLLDSYSAGDIFALIESSPGGEDGTVLAEIRDLRRYLLLVEAEIEARMSRRPQFKIDPEVAERAAKKILDRVEMTASGEKVGKFTSADGGAQSEFPWFASASQVVEKFKDNLDIMDRFYQNCGAGNGKLIPIVNSIELPRGLETYYKPFGPDRWALRIENCPEQIRDDFPRLQVEMNTHEFGTSPEDYRDMYGWSADGCKYQLRAPFTAWGRDA